MSKDKTESNIWIAENLMGLKKHDFKKGTGNIVSCRNCNAVLSVRADNLDGCCNMPNYFTEGWEQVEDKLGELGFCIISLTGACNGSKVELSIWNPKDLNSAVNNKNIIAETREQARYEAFKQAQPEIEKRLANVRG